jgi:hypothetical protein
MSTLWFDEAELLSSILSLSLASSGVLFEIFSGSCFGPAPLAPQFCYYYVLPWYVCYGQLID